MLGPKLSTNEELQQLNDLLEDKIREMAFLRRDKVQSLTVRVIDATHPWHTSVQDKRPVYMSTYKELSK